MARPSRRAGFTLVECTVVLGILGALGLGAVCRFDAGGCALQGLAGELPATLEQAFTLARARGTNVAVGLGAKPGPDVLPVQLPRQVRFGKPAHIPLPPGMSAPVRADRTGEAHATITVTPRRTATAASWFLTDGKDALYLKVSGQGRVQMLRWRRDKALWCRVG